ncbi:protein Shroom4 isoform X2 [Crotalus tigris]|uniref:protein Shroom4 isoform X2 n=1 Tax=Crotalus tigris TaxID=88082 RepID=UPI00192F2CF9|nr:protein Shroom4 isoform X2 [Crotalus tigris]
MERPPGQLQPDPSPQAKLPGRLLVSFQYLHVQLAGGAPWGFTLRGGLEHGEPLIVSKVEDGGKAALSQKMRSGDELVNINGTPLYGSRQEALILIKGSYRTLKMIIRRRNVPFIRPHSWHLAKLSKDQTEGTMTFPADPLSLSWHLDCETSDLPLPWNPLSPHCTTEKNGSLGSMESLDPTSQTYYEGSLFPIDQAMYQSKRDSAYSSFSASSSTSDSALRPEEAGSVDGTQPGQLPEPRYLQTGGEPAGLPSPASGVRLPSSVQSGSLPSPAKAAAVPPQPPMRQDSLRACNSPLEDPRAPSHTGSLCPEDRWSSDTALCTPGRDPHGQLATTGPLKDSPVTDQYYLLSSHTESHSGMMKKGPQTTPSSLAESPSCPVADPPEEKERTGEANNHAEPPSSWKAGWAGPFRHRHSIPEHMLVAQLQALDVSRGQEGPHWTVSPLHKEQKGMQAPEPWLNLDQCGQNPWAPAEEPDCPPTAEEGSPFPQGTCTALTALSGSPPLPALGNASTPQPRFQAAPHIDGLPDTQRSLPTAQKAQHRSAQIRRRSDRFATNLRNEIQWRKAQLQKAKGSGGLRCEEEPPPEEPPSHTATPALGEGRFRGSSGLPAVAPKRWGPELSVFGEEKAPCSPRRLSGDLVPKEKPLPLTCAGGGGGGRWRWSPQHKLQPQESEPGPSSQPPSEEPGLWPFADRRKFFEETSRLLPTRPYGSLQGRLDGTRTPEAEKSGSTEHGDFLCHSLDQSYRCPSSPPKYQDFQPEILGPCKSLARSGMDTERWWALPCSCAIRESCAYSFRDECAMLHSKNIPVPPSHHAHRCHPCSWSCHSECCCPGQQKLLEDGDPWQARKRFQMEFPLDEWEPSAVNRASSHTVSQLLQHKVAFARISPYWTCFERTDPAGPPLCRASSTHDLSWDCEQPRRVTEKRGLEGGPSEAHKPLLRERAYSESHLCTEPAGVSVREWQEALLAKAEETSPKSPPCQARRRGPPPPRPPPPNWEKYRPARASHQHLLPAQACLPVHARDSWAPGQPGFEAARQRSQSLPAEQLWHHRPQLQCPRLPCAGPDSTPSTPKQDNSHYYCHGSPSRSLEWLMTEASDWSAPSRAASSLEGAATEAHPLVGEQETSAGSPSEQPHIWRVPVSQDAAGESHKSGPPPLRLSSEELMRDVAGKDRSLAGVLSSGFGLRSAAEVMGDLFAASSCPLWPRQQSSPESGGAPPSYLTYLNLSAGTAELLNKTKEPSELAAASSEEDLAQKKVQLIESIGRKLVVLQEAQQSLQDDLSANTALGREVENYIKGACKPHEFEKFRLAIGDLDKVVNLLLSLSGRLARVENTLIGLNAEEEEEKMALLAKKRQLTAQLEDAKELQEHVAQREQLVFASISRCLPSEQLQDYQHFVRMKSALAIQQRQLDDKIKLGEEQLHCLWESLALRPREH